MRSRRISTIALSTLAVGAMAPLSTSAASAATLTPQVVPVSTPPQDGQIGVTVTDHGVSYSGTWSPDGRWVAFLHSAGSGIIMIARPDGSSAIPLPGTDTFMPFNSSLGWFSAQGSIVYSGLRGGTAAGSRLYVAKVDGSASARPLFPSDTADSDTNPDAAGNLVVFERQSAANPASSGIWVYNAATGTVKPIIPGGSMPAISYDGKRVAFVKPVGVTNVYQLFTANIDGSNVKQLTSGTGAWLNPSWSPSGTKIAANETWLDANTGAILGPAPYQSTWVSKVSWQPVLPATVTYRTADTIASVRGGHTVVDIPGAATVTGAFGAAPGLAATANGARFLYPVGDYGQSGVNTPYPSTLRIAAQDGSSDRELASPGPGMGRLTNPAVDPAGSYVIYTSSGYVDPYSANPLPVSTLYVTTTDGANKGHEWKLANVNPVPGESDDHAAFTPTGHILYERDLGGSADVMHFVNGQAAVLVANASSPSVSPADGRIAFVRPDAQGVNQVFLANADGTTGLIQLTTDPQGADLPQWSADGSKLVYSQQNTRDAVEVAVSGGAEVGRIADALSPLFTPSPDSVRVTREWGQDRIGTAIAASQFDFARAGDTADPRRDQASAVVLSRSDTYADALTGSALAVRKDGPLLITAPNALDPAVAAEISRVLKPGGTVYLLGGGSALSPAVEAAVQSLGYPTSRLSGPDRYATAAAVSTAIDPHPATVLVASGANFPDALAAGATGLPLVLTDGPTMPAATAAYLNGLNPVPDASGGTTIVTVGGPGDKALISGYQGGKMPSWPQQISRIPLVGAGRADTALLVARSFFGSVNDAAIATGASWPDALSGGAMVGHRGGPLLLTDPSGLYGPIGDYLAAESPSLWNVDMLGGPGALPNALVGQIQARIGTPGHVGYAPSAPGGPAPAQSRLPLISERAAVISRDGAAGTANRTKVRASAVSR